MHKQTLFSLLGWFLLSTFLAWVFYTTCMDVDVRKKGRGSSPKVFNDADTKNVLEYDAAEIQLNIFFFSLPSYR